MSNRSAAKFIKKKSQRTSVDWDNPRPAFPREVFFDISNACNHTCVFCSNTKISERAKMDKALAFRLLDATDQVLADDGLGEDAVIQHVQSLSNRFSAYRSIYKIRQRFAPDALVL